MYAIFDKNKNPLSPAFHGGITEAIAWMQSNKKLLHNANFADAGFPELLLEDMTFAGCDFEIADLHQVTFRKCSFIDCSFASTDLEGTVFDTCSLDGCDFTDAQLACCKFFRTGLVDNRFALANDFVAQFHIANLCLTFVNSWVTMGAEEDEYTEILRQWKALSGRLDLTRPAQRQILETLRHGFRLYELWLRDRAQAEAVFTLRSSPSDDLSANSTRAHLSHRRVSSYLHSRTRDFLCPQVYPLPARFSSPTPNHEPIDSTNRIPPDRVVCHD